MKRFFAFIMVIVAAMLLVGCGGKGSSASAPSNVNVVAGDTSITVSWDMQPGVTYWIWRTTGTYLDIQNCNACTTLINAPSPTVITGLTNGTTYSFSINGRTNGGPGGPGSPSVSATTRLAGGLDNNGISTWNRPGNPLGTQDLHGVAYGVPSVNTLGLGVFVAAGNSSLFSGIVSSTDGSISWTPSNNTPTNANLNALTYNSGKFLAVGDGGAILYSTDGATWASVTSGTISDLYAVSNKGSGFIATGANGTLLTSGDGINWVAGNSGTTNTLYGITYGNGIYVAVGANGTLITSTDQGAIWGTIASSTNSYLKGVAYGVPKLAYVYTTQNLPVPAATFVAVGANGTLVTSPDGVTWTTQNSISSTSLNAVTYGHQFVAVGDGGSIFTSIDGLTWLPTRNSAPSLPNLYAVMPATYVGGPYAHQYVYSAVGASGTNMLAQ
jgi:predicted small lipoprotein YifL